MGFQFFGYSSQLWRGKPFETFAHIAFTLFWAWLTTLFLITALAHRSSSAPHSR
jgi:hypothetical protein